MKTLRRCFFFALFLRTNGASSVMHHPSSIMQHASSIMHHPTCTIFILKRIDQMEFVTGSCKVMHGCDKGCSRFREDASIPILCGYCGHDISAYEILGMVKDGILIPWPQFPHKIGIDVSSWLRLQPLSHPCMTLQLPVTNSMWSMRFKRNIVHDGWCMMDDAWWMMHHWFFKVKENTDEEISW